MANGDKKKQSTILVGGEVSTAVKTWLVDQSHLIRFKPELISSSSPISEIAKKVWLRLSDSSGTVLGLFPSKALGNELVFDIMPEDPGFYLLEIGEVEDTPAGSDSSKFIEPVFQEMVQVVDKTNTDTTSQVNALQDIAKAVDKDSLDVSIAGTSRVRSEMLPLFISILESTKRLAFNRYREFIDMVLYNKTLDSKEFPEEQERFKELVNRRYLPFNDTDSYRYLKAATEAFLMTNVGIQTDAFLSDEAELGRELVKRNIYFKPNEPTFQALWTAYRQPHILNRKDPENLLVLPYLYTVRNKFRELGVKPNIEQQLQENVDLYLHLKQLPPALANVKILDSQGDDSGLHIQIENENLKSASLSKTKTEEQTTDPHYLEDALINIVQDRMTYPLFLELIWSYWHEESMMVQAMNAIALRFQNVRSRGRKDPLAEMEISHLLPLNNILWGYIQDGQHHLTVIRRYYEYAHHYGIILEGEAVRGASIADSRTRFVEAFHGLLNLAAKYYVEAANKLVEPDAFSILNALREIHFIISEGMHNQYGDLPTTARIEMLMQQWILARPELREFLPGRAAVPYTEAWMDRVASMNKLQGWTDTSPMHFNNLAVYGEQLLLSVRFGDWSNQSRCQEDAAQWALFFRPQIQGYIHSYKAATGVDLSATVVGNRVDSQVPAVHLLRRLQQQQNGSPAKSNGMPVRKQQAKSEIY